MSDSKDRSLRTSALEQLLQERILILDGAMGTMIQSYGLEEQDYRGDRFSAHPIPLKGNNDLLNLTQPQIIKAIHQAFVEAGADIVETNTFNSTSIAMADYRMEDQVYELNREGAAIAREVADTWEKFHPDDCKFVAGVLGPTNRTASISPDVNRPGLRNTNFQELLDAYTEAITGLVDGGADLLLLETIFDTLNAKAAIFAMEKYFDDHAIRLPVFLSGTITDASGRTLTGQTIAAFWHSLRHVNPLAVGLNCGFGAADLGQYIEELSGIADTYISLHPNAGLPNEFGAYDDTPEFMGGLLQDYARRGFVNIIGGCCGTTPHHIRAFAAAIRDIPPRRIPVFERRCRLSGLEPLTITPEVNFINIGERTNVAGSPRFLRLVRDGDLDQALSVARQQVENGAQIIDVCMDEGMLDARELMVDFLNLIAAEPDISRVPVMIDSSRWPVLEAGLRCIQGKGIVNSISLKEGEQAFLEHARLIRHYGAAAVVMAFDERGQADTTERRFEVCKRSYELLVNKVGFAPEDIIFDPNVLTVATGMEEHNNYAVSFFEATRMIKKHLPGALVSGGLSNVSFSFRGNNPVREAMHSAFLYHAIRAGLDMAIVNAGQLGIYDEIPEDLLEHIEDVLLNSRPDATDRLVEFSATVTAEDTETKGGEQAWRQAKTDNNFKLFAEAFAPLMELIRKKSETLSSALELDPYSALLQDYDPSVTKIDCDSLFTSLSQKLPSLIREVTTHQAEIPESDPLDWDTKSQMKICRQVIRDLGFDFEKGRLDKSAHPFTEGGVNDVRMTTQIEPHQPLHSLLSAIHECGHALYDLHLPPDWHTQPVGAALGMSVHEGVALFYEMTVARSTYFAHYLHQQCQSIGLSTTVDNIRIPLLKVNPGAIRIQADEVTYLAHLIIRYRIETKLLEGSLEIESIPTFWNEQMHNLLGITPKDYAEGCLQDIHWALGLFGYFPCYAIGFAHSCHLFRWLQEEIEQCDFGKILQQLDHHLFSRGSMDTKFFLLNESVQTTDPAEFILNYLEDKYLK